MISSVGRGIVESFYTSGYNNMVNAIDDNGIVVSLHDGFIGSGSWNEFLPGLPNILMDTHHYEVFDSGSLGMSPDAHVGSACAFGAGIAANTKSTISGEWTSAVTGMLFHHTHELPVIKLILYRLREMAQWSRCWCSLRRNLCRFKLYRKLCGLGRRHR